MKGFYLKCRVERTVIAHFNRMNGEAARSLVNINEKNCVAACISLYKRAEADVNKELEKTELKQPW
jgi:hypothetical protein